MFFQSSGSRCLCQSILFLTVFGCAANRQTVQVNSVTDRTETLTSVTPSENKTKQTPIVSSSVEMPTSKVERNHASSQGEGVVELAAAQQSDSEANLLFPLAPQTLESTPENELDQSQDGFSLASLEQLALANNPAIRVASASASQASGIQSQVGRYPNPTIGYFGSQLADAGTDQHGAFVEQEIVLGHKLALNERVLDQTVQAQLWNVETQRFRVLTDIRLRFYEALAAQRRVELTEEFHEVTTKGVDVAVRRRNALEGSQPEVLQAEIQLNEVDLARQRATYALTGAWQELAATVGIPNLEFAPLVGSLRPDTLSWDWVSVYQNLLASSPELRAAWSRVRSAQANIERQKAQPIPNLAVQLGAGVDNGTGSGLINLQVGAPIPVFNENTGNIDAAFADYCRATHEVKRIEMSLKARLARTAQEFDSAAAGVKRYEEQILPKARETLDLSEQAYTAGEFNFLQVLIVRRTYFESNLQYVQALQELAQANARLNGMLLTGGLDAPSEFSVDDGLRGQTFSQQ